MVTEMMKGLDKEIKHSSIFKSRQAMIRAQQQEFASVECFFLKHAGDAPNEII